MLLMQEVRMPLYLAFAKAGSSRLARMAMMAITTNSSMRVNASVERLASPLWRQAFGRSGFIESRRAKGSTRIYSSDTPVDKSETVFETWAARLKTDLRGWGNVTNWRWCNGGRRFATPTRKLAGKPP